MITSTLLILAVAQVCVIVETRRITRHNTPGRMAKN